MARWYLLACGNNTVCLETAFCVMEHVQFCVSLSFPFLSVIHVTTAAAAAAAAATAFEMNCQMVTLRCKVCDGTCTVFYKRWKLNIQNAAWLLGRRFPTSRRHTFLRNV